MKGSIELIVVPVADVDRAKEFYVDRFGFDLLVDHRAGEEFRVVQASPTGSGCAVALMANAGAAGSLHGIHLVVPDIEDARAELLDRGVEVSDLYHFVDGGRAEGPDPERRDYNTFCDLRDPDGNGWLIQEVTARR